MAVSFRTSTSITSKLPLYCSKRTFMVLVFMFIHRCGRSDVKNTCVCIYRAPDEFEMPDRTRSLIEVCFSPFLIVSLTPQISSLTHIHLSENPT